MSDETLAAQEAIEQYEPPVVVSLGSFTELTLDAPDGSLSIPH